MKKRLGLLVLVLLAGISCASLGRGQEPPGFARNKVTPLIKIDLTGVANKQVIANVYEVPAGAMVPAISITAMNFTLFFRVNGRPKLRTGRCTS